MGYGSDAILATQLWNKAYIGALPAWRPPSATFGDTEAQKKREDVIFAKRGFCKSF